MIRLSVTLICGPKITERLNRLTYKFDIFLATALKFKPYEDQTL